MVNNDLDMVFWQEEEEEMDLGQSFKLLLCCNAPQNEDWLKSQLPDFEEVGRSKNVTELKKILKMNESVHLAIIMRKTGSTGVDKPEEMAKIIREHSPDAQIFIIVGKKDERGIEIVNQAEKYGCRTLTAENGPIKAAHILKEVENLAKMAKSVRNQVSKQDLDNDKLQVVVVERAKGGSGQTTAMAVIAQLLNKQGKNVKVFDHSGGFSYLTSHKLDDLMISNGDIPKTGWLITETPIDELNKDYDLHRILIVDPSTEALVRAKEKITEDTILIVNRAEPTVLPNEIYTGEFKRAPNLIVPYNPTPYLLSDWESIFMEWEPLIDFLKEKR